MYTLKDETNFDEIVKKISVENEISKSSVEEMLIFNANTEVSDKLGIKFSELDAVLSGEANFAFFEKLDLTQADLDNLISEYGKNVVIGLLIGVLLNKK